jgi:hypothetical protein
MPGFVIPDDDLWLVFTVILCASSTLRLRMPSSNNVETMFVQHLLPLQRHLAISRQWHSTTAPESRRQSLPSGWMELTDTASNRRCYLHKTTSRMVFSKAEMLLNSLPVTPLPTTRMSLPATVGSLALEPD